MTDINKLPKWAKQLIEHQGREIATLRQNLEGLKLKPEDGDVYYSTCMEKFYLPKNVTIHIPVLEPKVRGDEYIITRQRLGDSEHMGDLCLRTRETTLQIEPQASNSVHLYTRKR